MLLQGVDIWMNTPTRPLEASGTSGEKGVMNGTLHFSVLDGWWCEGYCKDAGWALPEERTYYVQDFQDQLDAETIYTILETEILPEFYNRNKDGVPEKWVSYIKNTFAQVAPHFTTTRMINDYHQRYYLPQAERTVTMKTDSYALARELAAWKNKVASVWGQIELKDLQITDGITNVLKIGQEYPAKVVLDMKGLSTDDVGVEMVITENGENGSPELIDVVEFEADYCTIDHTCVYKLNLQLMDPGAYNYGIRVFAKNEHLPHRQDFMYLKWL